MEFVGDVVYHLVKLYHCNDGQNISGLYGGRMFGMWLLSEFLDEFDVFLDMELAAFEVVILTPDQFWSGRDASELNL